MKKIFFYNSLLVFSLLVIILNPVNVFSLAPESFIKEQKIKSEEYRLETTSDSLQQKRTYAHDLVAVIDRFQNRKQLWLENIRIWKNEWLVGHEFPFDDDSVNQAIQSLENFLSNMNDGVEGSVIEEKFADVDRAVGFYKIQMMRKLLSMVGELYGVSTHSTFTFIVDSLDSFNALKASKVDIDNLERYVKTQEQNMGLFLRNAIGNEENSDAQKVQRAVNRTFERLEYYGLDPQLFQFRNLWKQASQMLQDEDSRYNGVLYQLFLIHKLSDYVDTLKVQDSYKEELKRLQFVYNRKIAAYAVWLGDGGKESASIDRYAEEVGSKFRSLFHRLEQGALDIWRSAHVDKNNAADNADKLFHQLFF